MFPRVIPGPPLINGGDGKGRREDGRLCKGILTVYGEKGEEMRGDGLIEPAGGANSRQVG
jgi:hypothetical protein